MASRSSRWVTRWLLIGASTLLALIGVELALWLMGYPLDFYPPGFFQEDTGIGYHRLTPAFRGKVQTGETTYSVTTNSAGMRGGELAPRERVGWRILGLGDSFTFGIGIEDEQTYLRQLEQLLNGARGPQALPAEVLNGGVPGYGTIHELRYLEQIGLRYAPDLVLLGFYEGNDVSDNRGPSQHVVKGVLVPEGRIQFIDAKLWLRRHCRTYGFLANALKRQHGLNGILGRLGLVRVADPGMSAGYPGTVFYLKSPPPDVPDMWEETEALITKMHRRLQAQRIPLVVILIPDRVSVYDAWLERAARQGSVPVTALDGTKPDRLLERFCRQQGIPCLSLLPALQEAAATELTLYFHHDGHWTAAAHRIAAQQIFRFLKEHPSLRRAHRIDA